MDCAEERCKLYIQVLLKEQSNSKMESPGDYLESPMDGDDIAYPCKGCGDVRASEYSNLNFKLIVNCSDPRRRKSV